MEKYLIKEKISNLKKEAEKHKNLIAVVVLIAVIVLAAFGTQIALYINFLVGNDIVIKLDVDKQHLTLLHGEQKTIGFKESIKTNPFCSAECSYEFIGISGNITIDKNETVLIPGKSLNKEYVITANRLGSGQDLYRFDLNCLSKKTLLCRTKEKPVTRNILITADYDLNKQEKETKKIIKANLAVLSERFMQLRKQQASVDAFAQQLNENIAPEDAADHNLTLQVAMIREQMSTLNSLWYAEDYNAIEKNIPVAESMMSSAEDNFPIYQSAISNKVAQHNAVVEAIMQTISDLQHLKTIAQNEKLALLADDAIKEINSATAVIDSERTLNEKSDAASAAANRTAQLKKEISDEVLLLQTEAVSKYDELCTQTGECLAHLSVEERKNEQQDLAKVCKEITDLDAKLNKTTANCRIIEFNYTEILVPSIKKIEINEELNITQEFEFNEQAPKCCVFGVCKECCTDEECRNDPKTFPTVFLHGHAMNKGTSAEYSLEAFNEIQEKLEKDGYLNAGTITLYTSEDDAENVFGKSGVPVTIRASYYFDIFKEPENYIVVQSKSESINTYAIRLKDIIDIIKYKTGKQKVNLIAFSMGGLVARRYIQIFGEDNVNKLILIATPNQGISSDVADYCNIIGEKLECKDMNADSLFINKLNRQKIKNIPIANIVGTGCIMGSEQGDGIVLERSARLNWTDNYIIQGTCLTTEQLHTNILDIKQYSSVYGIILKALKEK